jgi:hypothetical protein
MFGDRQSVSIRVFALVALATAAWGTSIQVPHRPTPGDNARRTPVRRLASQHLHTPVHTAGPGVTGQRLDGEFQIDTTFDLAPEQGEQILAACASDGEQYLVVWEDEEGGSHISGTRVTAQGVLLDPLGIEITTSPGNNRPAAPAVTFAGSSYLVVWTDTLNGTNAVWGCRVGRDGVVFDSVPIRISSTPRPRAGAVVASDGVNSLVVWQNGGAADSSTIYGARVGPTGVVLDSVSFPIPESAGAQAEPAVAFDGSGWFVVWSQSRPGSGLDILGRHLGLDGAVVDSHDVVVSNAARDQEVPCVAFDGTDCLVAWSDLRNSNLGDIYGARVTGSGGVREPDGIAICGHDGGQTEPALSFNGAFWLAAWADDRFGPGMYGARVNPDGSVADSEGYVITNGEYYDPYPAVCADSSGRLMAVWNTGDVCAARLDSSGTVLDTSGFLLSGVISTQDNPGVASDGANYLAVWENEDASGTVICAGRVSPSGQPLDTARLNLSVRNTGYLPVVAFGGNYLAVWGNESDTFALRASRVTPAGAVLDPGGVGIGPQRWEDDGAAVASDGDSFLVVWDADAPRAGTGVYGTRVSAGGAVLDTPFILGGDTVHEATYPAVAFNGSDYLVAWADYDDNQSVSSICAVRVTPAGVVRDSAAIILSSVLTDYSYLAVTSDGNNWLAVWTGRDSNGARVVSGTRVSPEGTVLDYYGIGIAPANDSSRNAPPCAAFDGADYVVTWHRCSGGQASTWASLVSPQGAVVNFMPVTAMNDEYELVPIAHGPGHQVLTVFAAYTDSVNHFPVNGHRIWGKFSPFTGLAENRVSNLQSNKIATIVRGVLEIGSQLAANGSKPIIALLDISGRKVLDLNPGPNDVSRFAAGVYFVRLASGAGRGASSVNKVVLAR